MERNGDNSDIECYKKSHGKPVHVDIDKEVTEGEPTLALRPNRSEEDREENGLWTGGVNGTIGVRKSNRIIKSVLCYDSELKKTSYYFPDQPEKYHLNQD